MTGMLIFFIILVIAEIALLVGAIYAYYLLGRGEMMLLGARTYVPKLRNMIADDVRYGETAMESIQSGLRLAGELMPWWAKALLHAARWIGKIKLRTS